MRGVGDLVGHAAAAARRLASDVVSDVEVLLGALDNDTGQAREVLDRLDVTTAQLLDAARHYTTSPSPEAGEGNVSVSPSGGQLLHRAYGYALAHGRDHAEATDVMIAVLWDDPVSSAVAVLERCGLTTGQVAAALQEAGVPVPELPVPGWIEVPFGPRVTIPLGAADDVMEHLTSALGDRYQWGFNVEGDTMWLHGEQAADIPRRVADVMGAEGVDVDDSWARPHRVDADKRWRRRDADDAADR